MSNQHTPAAERFRAQFTKRRPDECWVWRGATRNGYGTLEVGGRPVYAHRFSLLHFGFRLARGMVVDHLCCNRRCVNPGHMELVTNSENVRRGHERRPDSNTCRNGHVYTTETLYIDPRGKRDCRTCRANARARYEVRHG